MSAGPDKIDLLAAAVGTAINGTNANVTTNASGVAANVAAIAAIDNSGIAAAQADATQALADAATAQSAADAAAGQVNGILAGANVDVDSFLEAFNRIVAGESADAVLTTAVGNRVRFDAGQALTAPQQVQARGNIAAADEARWGNDIDGYDFVTTFNTALTA